jgi:hypothetical protein
MLKWRETLAFIENAPAGMVPVYVKLDAEWLVVPSKIINSSYSFSPRAIA